MFHTAVELSAGDLLSFQLVQVLKTKKRIHSSAEILVVWKSHVNLLRQREQKIYDRNIRLSVPRCQCWMYVVEINVTVFLTFDNYKSVGQIVKSYAIGIIFARKVEKIACIVKRNTTPQIRAQTRTT